MNETIWIVFEVYDRNEGFSYAGTCESRRPVYVATSEAKANEWVREHGWEHEIVSIEVEVENPEVHWIW